MCVARGARVPTCLDAEVLRGSASTHAHPNLFSTFTCRFVTIEIQVSFTTVCLPGLKCALLYSQSIFFLEVARRNKNHSTPLVPSSPPHPCRLHSRRRTANSLSFHHLMIRRTPASQCHRRHHRYRVRHWWCIGESILRGLEVSNTFTLAGQMTDLHTTHS